MWQYYRAEATDFGETSGTTPFPIGVAKNGKLVDSISSLTCFSALPYAAPFPTITKGRFAFEIILTAFSMSWGFGKIFGGNVGP